MKSLLLILLVSLTISCLSDSLHSNLVTKSEPKNPIDFVLGDKITNAQTGEIRKNNFSDFLSISTTDLSNPSELYSITPIGHYLYRLQQKKRYSEARNFDAILKVQKDKVSHYKVMNDFQVIDQASDSLGLYILGGDFNTHNKYWKPENKIQLIRLDRNLKEVWSYSAKRSSLPLEAVSIGKSGISLLATINILAGCHICTHTIELRFDNKGHCISAVEVSRKNSFEALGDELIHEIFVK